MIRIASARTAASAAAAFAALALVAPTAGAQRYSRGVESHRFTVGVGGGASVPTTGSVRDALKTGVNWHGFVGFRPVAGLPMLRIAGDYQKFDFKKQPTFSTQPVGGATTATVVEQDAETKVLGGLANIGVDLLHGPVRPYVLAGVGAFNVKTEVSGSQSLSESKTHFGIDGGAGLAVNIGRIAAFVEGRVQNVYTERGYIDTKSITTVPVTFGLQF
jgi:opacity protein-like surface antigen